MIEFVAELLRICRANAAEFERVRGQHRANLRIIKSEAHRAVQAMLTPMQPAPAELQDLRNLFNLLPGLPQVVAARGIALGIDEATGDQFLGWFRGKRIQLRPNQPFPVVRADPVRLRANVGGAISGNPASLGERADETPRLRLAPAHMPYAVTLDCTLSTYECISHLLPRDRPLRMATATLNSDITEFNFHVSDAEETFFNVAPTAPEQQQWLRDAVKAAGEQGAHLLVLPELAVTQGMIPGIQQALDEASDSLRLVVAGSFHDDQGTVRRNRACVLAPGREEPFFWHDKINPYVHRSNGRRYTEDLQGVDPTIHVCVGESVSLSVVICKDLLQTDILRLLQDLFVRVVLVPSFSGEFDAFRSSVASLVTSNQTFVALANNPAKCGQVAALFAAPRERYAVTEESRPPDCPLPGVCVYDPGNVKDQTHWESWGGK